MSELQPLMYAELLANIRQVSVIVSLDTPCDANTSVDLSPQRDSITILHDRKTSTLPLPGQVAPNAMLQKPLQGSRDLSWRLPLAGEPTRGDADLNDSPWAANTLRKDTQFLCRSCDAGIVEEGSVVTWKDLPSENWAEMMDFWHCHKPTEHESHAGHSDEETAAANKGYAANSKFTAQNKVGFVDLTTFLLDAKDCNNIRVKTAPEGFSQVLDCSHCGVYIGHVDESARGYRLYKWRLKSPLVKVSYVSGPSDVPSTSSIITAQLQSIMLAQCCSKLILIPTGWRSSTNSDASTRLNELSEFKFLHFWVLNPTIRYTTNATLPRDYPHTSSNFCPESKVAMKIFWKPVSGSIAEKLMDTEGVEELILPQETIVEIERDLAESASLLPRTNRKFQDWDVGLMDRWEAKNAVAKDNRVE